MIFDGLEGRSEQNYPMKNLTTWKIGGPAKYCYWPSSQHDLLEVVSRARKSGLDLFLIGRGSNLLASDQGFKGLLIVTTDLKHIEWGEYTVKVDAGYSLIRLAVQAARRGWSGMEFACGIPGTVGGAVVMNAGAYGREIADCLTRVLCWNQELGLHRIERDALQFAYRECSLRGKEWVLEAELVFKSGDKDRIAEILEENLHKRQAAQPLEFPNAGSVFRNPPGDSAGRLIETAGWKGKRFGGAMVSLKHANFIINTGNAKAAEVLCLIRAIQEDVFKKFGVELTTEIQMIE